MAILVSSWFGRLKSSMLGQTLDPRHSNHIPAAPVAAPRHQVPPEALAAHTAWVKRLKEIVEEGQSVSSYVLKMKSYIDNLERLGHPVSLNLAVGKVQKNKHKKPHKAAKGNQGIGKTKLVYEPEYKPAYAPKPKIPPPPKKDNPAKDAIYHQCSEVGRWRRNCHVYLAELLKKKKSSQRASNSGIFTIELYSFPNTSWVNDTGCGAHICITTHGLMGSRTWAMVIVQQSKLLENITARESLKDLEIIQEEDTQASINTSSHDDEYDQEIDEPQSDINPIHNKVWDLVDLPPNGKTVGTKWLFKKKTNMNGAVHTFKARLVAKGFTQTYGVDFEETFSHVAYIRAIRILVAIAALYDYEI
ncbi:zinc finger, CCHC-type containing protein [Tanacetum coccineum]